MKSIEKQIDDWIEKYHAQGTANCTTKKRKRDKPNSEGLAATTKKRKAVATRLHADDGFREDAKEDEEGDVVIEVTKVSGDGGKGDGEEACLIEIDCPNDVAPPSEEKTTTTTTSTTTDTAQQPQQPVKIVRPPTSTIMKFLKPVAGGGTVRVSSSKRLAQPGMVRRKKRRGSNEKEGGSTTTSSAGTSSGKKRKDGPDSKAKVQADLSRFISGVKPLAPEMPPPERLVIPSPIPKSWAMRISPMLPRGDVVEGAV